MQLEFFLFFFFCSTSSCWRRRRRETCERYAFFSRCSHQIAICCSTGRWVRSLKTRQENHWLCKNIPGAFRVLMCWWIWMLHTHSSTRVAASKAFFHVNSEHFPLGLLQLYVCNTPRTCLFCVTRGRCHCVVLVECKLLALLCEPLEPVRGQSLQEIKWRLWIVTLKAQLSPSNLGTLLFFPAFPAADFLHVL